MSKASAQASAARAGPVALIIAGGALVVGGGVLLGVEGSAARRDGEQPQHEQREPPPTHTAARDALTARALMLVGGLAAESAPRWPQGGVVWAVMPDGSTTVALGVGPGSINVRGAFEDRRSRAVVLMSGLPGACRLTRNSSVRRVTAASTRVAPRAPCGATRAVAGKLARRPAAAVARLASGRLTSGGGARPVAVARLPATVLTQRGGTTSGGTATSSGTATGGNMATSGGTATERQHGDWRWHGSNGGTATGGAL